MNDNPRRLRRPEERVGQLTNADLPPPHEADADIALVHALRARDEKAFEQLIDRYYTPMLRIATGFVRSHEEAEEVIQDTWIAVLSGIGRFEGRSSFKTWLFRILLNRARTRGARESRMVPFSQHGDIDAPAIAPDAESAVLSAELRARVEAAIAELPPNQREVITLRDVEGWDASEVCETLDLTAANQRVLLHRARMKVRDALASYF